MLRSVSYRLAVQLFVFTGLWLAIGMVVLWSPVPGALGIEGGFFVLWLLLFFALLAISGGALTLAGLNGAFPSGQEESPRKSPATAIRMRADERLRSLRGEQPPQAAAATPRPSTTLWAPEPGVTPGGSGAAPAPRQPHAPAPQRQQRPHPPADSA
jgi:hypothetical protein